MQCLRKHPKELHFKLLLVGVHFGGELPGVVPTGNVTVGDSKPHINLFKSRTPLFMIQDNGQQMECALKSVFSFWSLQSCGFVTFIPVFADN